jgi:hypothetical protein
MPSKKLKKTARYDTVGRGSLHRGVNLFSAGELNTLSVTNSSFDFGKFDLTRFRTCKIYQKREFCVKKKNSRDTGAFFPSCSRR